jgi:hypothetical protein
MQKSPCSNACHPLNIGAEPYFFAFRFVAEIGEIEHVEDSTANTIFFVGDKLIPATEDFIMRIDPQKRTIYMNLPEGLLDL